jgi:hypothetical protein
LSKRNRSGKLVPSQVGRVGREIALTDREIDEPVYGLYDITAEEQKIVGGQAG